MTSPEKKGKPRVGGRAGRQARLPAPIQAARDELSRNPKAALALLLQGLAAAPDPAFVQPLTWFLLRADTCVQAGNELASLLQRLPAESDFSEALPAFRRIADDAAVEPGQKEFLRHVRPAALVRGLGHADATIAAAAARLLARADWRPGTAEERAATCSAALVGLAARSDPGIRAAVAAYRPETGLDGALIVAAAGDPALAQFLRGIAADWNAVDAAGCTALIRHLDRKTPDFRVLDELIAPGWARGARNRRGETALHVAARRGHRGAVEDLLKAGADPRATDCAGRTPRAAAEAACVPVEVELCLRAAIGWRVLTPADWIAAVERQRAWRAAGGGGGPWTFRRARNAPSRWICAPAPDAPGDPEDLSGTAFDGLPDRDLVLEWADLHGSNGRQRCFQGARLAGCLLAVSDFRAASFRDAHLAHADFTRSLLAGCDFRGADLSHAVFDGADVTGARLVDARLDGTRISPEQLARTRRARWRIECVQVRESATAGPDYEIEYEYRVTDERNDQVFQTFESRVNEYFMGPSDSYGTKGVALTADGKELRVTFHDDRPEQRIRLPE